MPKLITTDCHISPPFSVLDELPESCRPQHEVDAMTGGTAARLFGIKLD